MTGIHKTALFLSGLPEESAQALLQRLEPTTAKKVRVEMMRLSGTPKEKVRLTVAEFLSALEAEEDSSNENPKPAPEKNKPRNNAAYNNVPENNTKKHKDVFLELSTQAQAEPATYDRTTYELPERKDRTAQETLRPEPQTMDSFSRGVDSLSRAKTGDIPTDDITNDEVTPQLEDTTSFIFLHRLQPEQMRELLLLESPQIIAVVLSQIPSELAGHVLEQMTPTAQKDVISRLLQLEEPEPDVLAEIENILRERSEYLFERDKKKIGISKAKEILKVIDPSVRLNLLSEASLERMIAESNPDASLQSLLAESRRIIQEQKRNESYWADRRNPGETYPNHRTDFHAAEPRPLHLPMDDASSNSYPQGKTTPEYQGAARTGKYRMSNERIDFDSLEYDPLATPRDIEPRPRESQSRESQSQQRRKVSFEDLRLIPDRGLKELFNTVDAETALVALVGAPQDLIERIFNHCTPEQEKGLSRKLQSLGPIRQLDVENARTRILENLNGAE